MAARVETRKRSRDEDGSDFMPLSKRINNLHINNPSPNHDSNNYLQEQQQIIRENNEHQQQQQFYHHHLQNHAMHNHNPHHQQQQQHHHLHNQQHHHHHHHQQQHQPHVHQPHTINEREFHQYHDRSEENVNSIAEVNNNINNHNNRMHFYDPELNSDQNPIYYNKNKLLYDLHAERVLRTN